MLEYEVGDTVQYWWKFYSTKTMVLRTVVVTEKSFQPKGLNVPYDMVPGFKGDILGSSDHDDYISCSSGVKVYGFDEQVVAVMKSDENETVNPNE